MFEFNLFLNVLYFLIGLYFFIYSAYWLLLSLLGIIYSKRKRSINTQSIEIEKLVILFPAFKPNLKLIEAIKAAKNIITQIDIEILVILQEDINNIKSLIEKENVTVIEKSFKNVKGNPYHEVLRYSSIKSIEKKASHILLLDKDNVADKDFLNAICHLGDKNAHVWQGKRQALNQENNWSTYDTLSEKLNDMLLREAKRTINLPPELSGSAIVFKIDTFSKAVKRLDRRAPGMDKNLLIQLLLSDQKIDYVPEAIVWEEKTASIITLQTQRVRWFGNQYFNALYWGKSLIFKCTKASLDYLITLYRPPRSIQIILLPLLAITEILLNNSHYLFTINLLLTYLGIFLFISKEKAWSAAKRIVFSLPIIAFKNLKSALNGISKKQQGKFISTERELVIEEKNQFKKIA